MLDGKWRRLPGRANPACSGAPGITESHGYRLGDVDVTESGSEDCLFSHSAGRTVTCATKHRDDREDHVSSGLVGVAQLGTVDDGMPEIVPRFPAREGGGGVAEGFQIVDGSPEPDRVASHTECSLSVASSVGAERWCCFPTGGKS